MVAVGATGNLDHNPSSIIAQRSFHGREIGTIQHATTENPSKIKPNQFSINTSLKEADLPEYYSIIPAATNGRPTIKSQT